MDKLNTWFMSARIELYGYSIYSRTCTIIPSFLILWIELFYNDNGDKFTFIIPDDDSTFRSCSVGGWMPIAADGSTTNDPWTRWPPSVELGSTLPRSSTFDETDVAFARLGLRLRRPSDEILLTSLGGVVEFRWMIVRAYVSVIDAFWSRCCSWCWCWSSAIGTW